MRVLKLVLISIAVFGILILALSLLFPSSVRISRAINIGVSKEEVQRGLSNFREWQYWNEMTSKEELTNKKFSDSFFLSDQMKVSLVSASGDAVITSWDRYQKEKINSGFNLITAADSTIVQWYFDFRLRWYPWEKFGSIIFDKQLGRPMENSLMKFKNFMENNR
ncbi:MAG: hypothetical protein H7122_03015 [Chitinophagaceae bacterium]|nr:hypothetical protein [Chitinophagaceae bacterium]